MAKHFEFQVIETRTVEVNYVVEADSLDEAMAKAEIGDTIEEYAPDNSRIEVINRSVLAHIL